MYRMYQYNHGNSGASSNRNYYTPRSWELRRQQECQRPQMMEMTPRAYHHQAQAAAAQQQQMMMQQQQMAQQQMMQQQMMMNAYRTAHATRGAILPTHRVPIKDSGSSTSYLKIVAVVVIIVVILLVSLNSGSSGSDGGSSYVGSSGSSYGSSGGSSSGSSQGSSGGSVRGTDSDRTPEQPSGEERDGMVQFRNQQTGQLSSPHALPPGSGRRQLGVNPFKKILGIFGEIYDAYASTCGAVTTENTWIRKNPWIRQAGPDNDATVDVVLTITSEDFYEPFRHLPTHTQATQDRCEDPDKLLHFNYTVVTTAHLHKRFYDTLEEADDWVASGLDDEKMKMTMRTRVWNGKKDILNDDRLYYEEQYGQWRMMKDGWLMMKRTYGGFSRDEGPDGRYFCFEKTHEIPTEVRLPAEAADGQEITLILSADSEVPLCVRQYKARGEDAIQEKTEDLITLTPAYIESGLPTGVGADSTICSATKKEVTFQYSATEKRWTMPFPGQPSVSVVTSPEVDCQSRLPLRRRVRLALDRLAWRRHDVELIAEEVRKLEWERDSNRGSQKLLERLRKELKTLTGKLDEATSPQALKEATALVNEYRTSASQEDWYGLFSYYGPDALNVLDREGEIVSQQM